MLRHMRLPPDLGHLSAWAGRCDMTLMTTLLGSNTKKRRTPPRSAPNRLVEHGVHVGHLDRHLWHEPRRPIPTHEGDLSGRVGRRGQRDDRAEVHPDLEAKPVEEELPALAEALGREAGDDP